MEKEEKKELGGQELKDVNGGFIPVDRERKLPGTALLSRNGKKTPPWLPATRFGRAGKADVKRGERELEHKAKRRKAGLIRSTEDGE